MDVSSSLIGDLIDLGDFGIQCSKKYASPMRTDLLTGNIDHLSALKTKYKNKVDESLVNGDLKDDSLDVEESLEILDLNQADSLLSPFNSSPKDLANLKDSKTMSPVKSTDLTSINELDLAFIGSANEASEEEEAPKTVQFSTPNLPTTTPGKSPLSRMVQKFASLSLVTPQSSKLGASQRVADLSSIYRPSDCSLQDDRCDLSSKEFLNSTAQVSQCRR